MTPQTNHQTSNSYLAILRLKTSSDTRPIQSRMASAASSPPRPQAPSPFDVATPIPLTSSRSSPLDNAITFCSNIYYHRSLHIPASSSHGKLRVTYATTTNFENAELPVVLFCHPMGAARYLIFGFEEAARREGVRVVIVDRYVCFPLPSSSPPPRPRVPPPTPSPQIFSSLIFAG